MPIPLAIPIALGAASFLKGLFGHKAEQKKADAERKAQEAALAAQTANWNANEATRGARVNATAAGVRQMQPSLRAGAPNYAIDPTLEAKLAAPRPYAGSLPVDPRAGLGYSFLSGLAGGGADVLQTILLGKLGAENGGETTQSTPSRIPGGQNLCAKYPNIPGCGGGTPMINPSAGSGESW